MATPPVTVSLVPFCEAIHAGRLREWLKAPHVSRWWGKLSLEVALDTSAEGDFRVVQAGSSPVGFIRWQRVRRVELDGAGLHEIEAGGIDFDLFIGEPEFLGNGIGGQALARAMRLVEGQGVPVPYFCLDTQVANARAVRCCQKAGFAIVREFTAGDRYFFLRRHSGRSRAKAMSV